MQGHTTLRHYACIEGQVLSRHELIGSSTNECWYGTWSDKITMGSIEIALGIVQQMSAGAAQITDYIEVNILLIIVLTSFEFYMVVAYVMFLCCNY